MVISCFAEAGDLHLAEAVWSIRPELSSLRDRVASRRVIIVSDDDLTGVKAVADANATPMMEAYPGCTTGGVHH